MIQDIILRLDFRMHMDLIGQKFSPPFIFLFGQKFFLNYFKPGFTHPSSSEILHEHVFRTVAQRRFYNLISESL